MQGVIRSLTVGALIEGVAAKTPTPGGGAVAGAVGALAAALANMVVAYSVGKKSLEAHDAELRAAAGVLTRAADLMLQLADEDAQAYAAVNAMSRLPEGDPGRAGLAEAQRAAVQVPMAGLAASVDLLRRFEALAGMTNKHLRSDLGIAAVLAEATARACEWNVRINAPSLGAEGGAALAAAAGLVAQAARLSASTQARCAS